VNCNDLNTKQQEINTPKMNTLSLTIVLLVQLQSRTNAIVDIRYQESQELFTELSNAYCADKSDFEPCNEALGKHTSHHTNNKQAQATCVLVDNV
jgi:hypothetical protein